jgi:DNA-binding MarR family transcriptional regulator
MDTMKKEEMDLFAESMAENMGVIFKALNLGIKKKLCEMNIGPPHMKVLVLLNSLEKEPTISKISRDLSISLAMMTRIIDRLEEEKQVLRIADPKDRRAIRIRITEKGRKIAHGLRQMRKKEMIKLLNSFGEMDRQRFMKAMHTIVDILLRYRRK